MCIQSIKVHTHRKDEIFNLLSQLTTTPPFDTDRFQKIILGLNDNHNIYCCIRENKLVGMVTLFIEQKLIHNGSSVGHIEDLVVDSNYRGQGIAKSLIKHCIGISKQRQCYKIILDGDRELVGFYEKCGFKEKEVQMAMYI